MLLLLLVGLTLTACKRHEAGTETVASDTPGTVTTAEPSPRGPPGMTTEGPPPVVAENSDINAVLHDLSLELRKYVVRTRSVPKNFEEFAAKSHVQAPPAPAGKKYAIQGQVVVLVKN